MPGVKEKVYIICILAALGYQVLSLYQGGRLFGPQTRLNPDNLAKSQNAEHPPLKFHQVTRLAGVGLALFARPTILVVSSVPAPTELLARRAGEVNHRIPVPLRSSRKIAGCDFRQPRRNRSCRMVKKVADKQAVMVYERNHIKFILFYKFVK
jgi:hypothetical protein